MDPQARHSLGNDDIDRVDAEDVLPEGYTAEELLVLLQESEDSGLCELSFEEIFDQIFEKHFGKEALIEAREARKKG